MAKFTKTYYYTSKGEKKLNCYMIPIPKKIVEEAQLQDKEIEAKAENKKIILISKS